MICDMLLNMLTMRMTLYPFKEGLASSEVIKTCFFFFNFLVHYRVKRYSTLAFYGWEYEATVITFIIYGWGDVGLFFRGGVLIGTITSKGGS